MHRLVQPQTHLSIHRSVFVYTSFRPVFEALDQRCDGHCGLPHAALTSESVRHVSSLPKQLVGLFVKTSVSRISSCAREIRKQLTPLHGELPAPGDGRLFSTSVAVPLLHPVPPPHRVVAVRPSPPPLLWVVPSPLSSSLLLHWWFASTFTLRWWFAHAPLWRRFPLHSPPVAGSLPSSPSAGVRHFLSSLSGVNSSSPSVVVRFPLLHPAFGGDLSTSGGSPSPSVAVPPLPSRVVAGSLQPLPLDAFAPPVHPPILVVEALLF